MLQICRMPVAGIQHMKESPMLVRLSNLATCTLLVFGFSSVVSAQTSTAVGQPTFELSAGYQYLHIPDRSFPFGVVVDGARQYGPFGLAAEVGWSRDSND